MKGAKNEFAAIEDLSDDELAKLHDECRAQAEMTLHHLNTRREKSHRKPRAAAHRQKAPRRTSRQAAWSSTGGIRN
jgi:hypothetical protein